MATTPTYIWKKSKYLCSIVYTHEMLEDKKNNKNKKKAPLHPRGLSLILKATPLPPPTPSAASAIRAWQPVLPARQPRRPQKLSHLTQPSAYLDVSFFFLIVLNDFCFHWCLRCGSPVFPTYYWPFAARSTWKGDACQKNNKEIHSSLTSLQQIKLS